MKVNIAPDAVMQGASALAGVRGSLPSGWLPPVVGVGDHTVETARTGLEDWWKTMTTGTADDLGAVHQLVTAATTAQVSRDHQAAAEIDNGVDLFAPFRGM